MEESTVWVPVVPWCLKMIDKYQTELLEMFDVSFEINLPWPNSPIPFHQIETKKVFEQQLWNMDLSEVDEQELKKYGWIKLKVVNNWRWICSSSFTKKQPEKMQQRTII